MGYINCNQYYTHPKLSLHRDYYVIVPQHVLTSLISFLWQNTFFSPKCVVFLSR